MSVKIIEILNSLLDLLCVKQFLLIKPNFVKEIQPHLTMHEVDMGLVNAGKEFTLKTEFEGRADGHVGLLTVIEFFNNIAFCMLVSRFLAYFLDSLPAIKFANVSKKL